MRRVRAAPAAPATLRDKGAGELPPTTLLSESPLPLLIPFPRILSNSTRLAVIAAAPSTRLMRAVPPLLPILALALALLLLLLVFTVAAKRARLTASTVRPARPEDTPVESAAPAYAASPVNAPAAATAEAAGPYACVTSTLPCVT